MKTKKHTTVVITRKWLEDAGCCTLGVENVAHLLPAKISTDPEKNIKLAAEVCNTPRASRAADAYFIVLQTTNEYTYPDASDYYKTPTHDTYQNVLGADVGVTAQYLAWVADHIATKEGR